MLVRGCYILRGGTEAASLGWTYPFIPTTPIGGFRDERVHEFRAAARKCEDEEESVTTDDGGGAASKLPGYASKPKQWLKDVDGEHHLSMQSCSGEQGDHHAADTRLMWRKPEEFEDARALQEADNGLQHTGQKPWRHFESIRRSPG
ncbi:hypothetical protein NL676_005819 [Syzygium grande]|nr:hypothetical protein NL676_005819 [Syzygium grande]